MPNSSSTGSLTTTSALSEALRVPLLSKIRGGLKATRTSCDHKRLVRSKTTSSPRKEAKALRTKMLNPTWTVSRTLRRRMKMTT